MNKKIVLIFYILSIVSTNFLGTDNLTFKDQNEESNSGEETELKVEKKEKKKKTFQKVTRFDKKNILDQLDKVDCFTQENKKLNNDQYLDLVYCLKNLEEYFFSPIMKTHNKQNNLNEKLNELIYEPLASNSPRLRNATENFTQLLLNKGRNNFFDNSYKNIYYKDVESSIMKNFNIAFANIHKKDWYKQVAQNFTQILKDLHVYWNSQRSRDQISQVRQNTKLILGQIIDKYNGKENFNFEVTKSLVQKIRQGYQKFIIAHQAYEAMKENGLEIISKEIIQIYQSFFKKQYKDQNEYEDDLNILIQKILDLNMSFMFVYHKLPKQEKTLQQYFEKQIYQQIQEQYQQLQIEHCKCHAEFEKLKYITAIILLKLKHQFFIFNNYHNNDLIHTSESINQPSKKITVKIYYELMDQMTNLLSKCMDSTILKQCVFYEIKNVFTNITQKYSLKKSYTGIHLHYYLQNFFQYLMKDFKNKDYDDINKLKQYYYPRLFKVLFNFKFTFKIKDDKSLDILEKSIGNLIDDYKLNIDGILSNIKFKLLDQLDIDIYDKFLDIKSIMDDYSPITSDKLAILEVEKQIIQFLKIFEESFSKEIDENFQELVDNIINIVTKWRYQALNNLGIQTPIEPNIYILGKHHDIFSDDKDIDFKKSDYNDQQKIIGENYQTIDDIEKQKIDKANQLQQVKDSEIQEKISKQQESKSSQTNDTSLYTRNYSQENNFISDDIVSQLNEDKKPPIIKFGYLQNDDIYNGHSNVNTGQQNISPDILNKEIKSKDYSSNKVDIPIYSSQKFDYDNESYPIVNGQVSENLNKET